MGFDHSKTRHRVRKQCRLLQSVDKIMQRIGHAAIRAVLNRTVTLSQSRPCGLSPS